jgi:hypothetical protein
MGSRTVLEALYIFTNESLLHKMHTKPVNLTSFESFVASLSIDDSETSDVLTSLSTIEIGDYLPAVESTPPAPRGDGDDSDDVASDPGSDSSGDDEEEDDDYVYLKDAEVPDGFEAVVMAEPPTYIPNDAIDSHYIMLCCDDLEWMLGKIIKMNKSTARLQLNVEWKQGDVAGQQAKLSNYFAVGGDDRPTAGKWFYVKSSRSATSQSSRASRRRPRGEGGEESNEDSGDEQEQEEEGDADSDA